MLKVFLSFALLFSCLFLQNCNSAKSDNLQSNVETDALPQPTEVTQNQDNKIQLPTTGKVEFKGVSFNYNPQIFGKVDAEEVAEQPLEYETDIPDYVAPQHFLFTLKAQNQSEAIIAVYPIEEYRRVWIPVEKNDVGQFNRNLRYVKKFIANKNFRVKGEIPYLPYNAGLQTVEAKVKNFSFKSGKGSFFLTQGVEEEAIVNNEQLEYDFQGISEDGKYYILAQFSPKVSFLPDNYYGGKFEDYSIPDNMNWNKSERKKYNEYIAKITKRLENLPSDKYEPNLKYFEEIISSLKIER